VIYVLLDDLDEVIDHELLRHLPAHVIVLKVVLIHPNLHDSLFVYADVLFFNGKAANLLRQLLESLQALEVDMQEVGKGHMFDVRQSNGYFFDE
jgi:hypothetical protein